MVYCEYRMFSRWAYVLLYISPSVESNGFSTKIPYTCKGKPNQVRVAPSTIDHRKMSTSFL